MSSFFNEKLGFTQWTNHSEGPIYGKVFTVNHAAGAVLIALLSVYSKTAMGCLFGACRFLVFYFRSSPDRKHGYHHQFQAILRNRSSPVAMVLDSSNMIETWRKHGGGAKRKAFRMGTFAAGIAALILAVSLVTSQISKTPQLIQLQPDFGKCGVWQPQQAAWDNRSAVSLSQSNAANSIWQTISDEAARSARVCYNGTQLSGDTACVIPGKSLPTFTATETPVCPLGDVICEAGTSPMFFDSGYISSLDHLGINTPRVDSVYLKMNQTCAPINVTNYVIKGNNPDYRLGAGFYGSNQSYYAALQLGPMNNRDFGKYVTHNDTSVFGFWPGIGFVDPVLSFARGGREDYVLDPQQLTVGTDGYWRGTFTPRADLPVSADPNAIIDLLVLANGASFEKPVNDPWFRAQQYDPVSQRYVSRQVVTMLACAENKFICARNDPNDDGCILGENPGTDWLQYLLGSDLVSDFTTEQKLLIPRMMQSLYLSNMFSIGLFMRAQGLLASSFVYNGQSSQLPDNQWILELQSMFASSLVALQLTSAELVHDTLQLPFSRTPYPANQTFQCGNQLISNGAAISFSVLGVCVILIAGCLFFILEKTLPSIIEFLPPHTPLKEYRLKDWYFHNFYQLQRVAFESNAAGTWEGEHKVPTTMVEETFAAPVHAFSPSLSKHNTLNPGYSEKDSAESEKHSAPAPPLQHRGGSWDAYNKTPGSNSQAVYQGPRG